MYTVLYGDHYTLLEQPVRRRSDVDFIAFTDDPRARSKTWTIRHLPPLIPTDLPRSSRFPKICAHRVLPDYDVSLYIDSKVLLKTPPETVIEDLLVGTSDSMSCLRHECRSTIQEEAEEIIRLGYDLENSCRAQLLAYARDGYTGAAPLIWGGMLMRFHNRDDVANAMDRWFAQVLRYSRRDQLSFPYVAEKAKLSFTAHPFSNQSTKWHRWPVPRSAEANHPPADAESPMRDRDEIGQELARLNSELLAMRASNSWRITEPLRRFARMVRR